MTIHSPAGGRPPHCACCRVYYLLYPDIQRIRAAQQEILDFIREKQEAEVEYLSAEQALDRIGISHRTLLRCQRRGEITIAKKHKGKKYFRKHDVERLRKTYWGLP